MPEPKTQKAEVAASPATKAVSGDHDRVVMASRRPDGTPDQTPDFTYIGDQDASVQAAKEQLRQQAVSAEDVRLRGVAGAGGPGEEVDDPSTAELRKAHESAAKSAERAAESEVKARFEET